LNEGNKSVAKPLVKKICFKKRRDVAVEFFKRKSYEREEESEY